MDVKLTAEQQQLLRSVKEALDRHRSSAGAVLPYRADVAAQHVLGDAGFLDILEAGGSAVEATLVVEQAAISAPGAPTAARALVGPLLTGRESLPACIALVEGRSGTVSRFAPLAEAYLTIVDDEAWISERDQVDVVPEASRWGYPVGRVEVRSGESFGPGSGEGLARLWRIGLAAEAGGLMEASTLLAKEHAASRIAFGRPIGALQAIQHRLARSFALSQGVKWLARRAAWAPDDPAMAAAAAGYAAEGMREALSATHQVAGAIGITDEFGLLAYTARMARLQVELGGAAAHARALARFKWPADSPVRSMIPFPPTSYRPSASLDYSETFAADQSEVGA